MKTKGKVVIVTGGANGIGRAAALRLAREGASVVIADIDLTKAKHVAAEIESLGGKALPLEVNITKMSDAHRMVQTTLEHFGTIDVLVNNAGGSFSEKRVGSFLHETPDEVIDLVIALNLKGPINGCRAVAKHMLEKKSGKIINISSTSGMVGSDSGKADYAAAKSGIFGLTQSLAKELSPHGITVTCVSPGQVDNPRPLLVGELAKKEEAKREKLRRMTPLGRLGKPEEIANLIVFLASDESSFMTGHNYAVNGGRDLGY